MCGNLFAPNQEKKNNMEEKQTRKLGFRYVWHGVWMCRMSWKIYFFLSCWMAFLFLIRWCDSISLFFTFSFLSLAFFMLMISVTLCVCEKVTIVSLSSMITAIMSVDLSSTCLFTFLNNTRVNSIFFFISCAPTQKSNFLLLQFISFHSFASFSLSVFFSPTFLCSLTLSLLKSGSTKFNLYYVYCWSRCDFKIISLAPFVRLSFGSF